MIIAAGAGNAHGNGPVAVERLATTCSSGTCPTVFRSDRGTIMIQGYAVDADRAGVTLSPGEFLVEVPAELLTGLQLAEG